MSVVLGRVAPVRVAAVNRMPCGALSPRLRRLRAISEADRSRLRTIGDVRCDQAKLDRLLAAAVGQAVGAHALEVPSPTGLGSWGAEELARLPEREPVSLVTANVRPVLEATAVPKPRWDVVDASVPSAFARSSQARRRHG
jgi:hypothetical protein